MDAATNKPEVSISIIIDPPIITHFLLSFTCKDSNVIVVVVELN